MDNTKVIELLNEVLLRLENLVNKLDENGLLSMTRIARSRGESLKYYRRKYENAVADDTPFTTSHHGSVDGSVLHTSSSGLGGKVSTL